MKINVVREIKELKNQISYTKNIGFFFGAGSSCALGIPNILKLTEEIEGALKDDLLKHFLEIKKDLTLNNPKKKPNIEDILSQIRRIRDITGEKEEKNYLSINGLSAKKLDIEICRKIYEIISKGEEKADIENTKKFLAWLSMQNRDYSKEIFTTNYDLIFEKALEEAEIPYFDGFVGSYEPFFWQESVDTFIGKSDLTKNWIRLWKIHGSLNWFWKENEKTNTIHIVRGGKISKGQENEKAKNELVIYPSKEKYDSSKKQPFVAYFDRLKNYLLKGELLFVFSGYSFSDQHINEIILNCLRQNNRLFCLVFFFKDDEVEAFHQLSSSYLNISVFGPTKAIVNGVLGEWVFNNEGENENALSCWNSKEKKMSLGDFNSLVDFLITNSMNRKDIEDRANGK